MDLTVTHDPLFNLLSAGFELGLNERDHCSFGPDKPQKPGKDETQRNERNVDGDKIHFLADIVKTKIPSVKSLFYHYPRVLAQFPMELPAAHIYSIDLGCSMLEKAISESASGSADIQAYFPRGIDPESFEGSLELFASAGYVPWWGENLDVRGGRNRSPRFIHANPVNAHLSSQNQSLSLRPRRG
jgi:hypothetical protein